MSAQESPKIATIHRHCPPTASTVTCLTSCRWPQQSPLQSYLVHTSCHVILRTRCVILPEYRNCLHTCCVDALILLGVCFLPLGFTVVPTLVGGHAAGAYTWCRLFYASILASFGELLVERRRSSPPSWNHSPLLVTFVERHRCRARHSSRTLKKEEG